jgi:nucleotide-binding universal stress UspA family protein
MQTILVPTDFSPTARNSGVYAAHLAKYLGAKKLVLYNAYSMPLATEMSWAILQTEELQKASEASLEEFKNMMQSFCGPGIEVQTISDFGFLQERLARIADDVKADLIVMGITGGGKLEEVLVGSNTTHIIHHTHVPVLIVPPDALWKEVKKIGWACDYKEVMKSTPAESIKNMIGEFHASLVVVHNDPNPKAFDPDMFHNNVMVGELFSHLKPEFVREEKEHIIEAIDDFVKTYSIDMLLVIPKKHSWIDSVFRRSNTTRLAYHSHIPLLCIRSIEAK